MNPIRTYPVTGIHLPCDDGTPPIELALVMRHLMDNVQNLPAPGQPDSHGDILSVMDLHKALLNLNARITQIVTRIEATSDYSRAKACDAALNHLFGKCSVSDAHP